MTTSLLFQAQRKAWAEMCGCARRHRDLQLRHWQIWNSIEGLCTVYFAEENREREAWASRYRMAVATAPGDSARRWRAVEGLAAAHVALEPEELVEGSWSALNDEAHAWLEDIAFWQPLSQEADERASAALENRAARAALLEWCPEAARRAWMGKYGFMGHALPLSPSGAPTSRARPS